MYGLPKIHKDNIPLRPIVSCINSPTYNLSKFLSDIIYRSIDHSKYNITNSFEFKEFIIQQHLPTDYILVSLDVVSLFTNIPLVLILENIDERWQKISQYTSIPLHRFKDVTKFALTANYFVFSGEYYYQTDVKPMGSCLSPAIADMVMEFLLDNVRKKLVVQLSFVRKYVDDLILAIPNGMERSILDIFNSYNDRLQFTIEIEVNGRIPFLDMLLIRNIEDGSISTQWYKKPIASGRILNYYSSHNYNQKINTASGFIHRVVSLTSHVTEDTFAVASRSLLNNNYPRSVVNRLINKFRTSNSTSVNPVILDH